MLPFSQAFRRGNITRIRNLNSLIVLTIMLEYKGSCHPEDILVNTFSISGKDFGPIPCPFSYSGKEGWP